MRKLLIKNLNSSYNNYGTQTLTNIILYSWLNHPKDMTKVPTSHSQCVLNFHGNVHTFLEKKNVNVYVIKLS